ncbi:MAG: nuclear transport factor 2 family protein [Actinomycetota bacterium]
MSGENVEIVRAGFDAVNRGDVDAAFKDIAPDAEFDQSRAVGFDRGVYNVDQWRRLLEEFSQAWESVRFEADEFIDAGDHVVTPFTNRFLGRDGVEVQARGTWVWTIREGAVVRVCLYQERQEALEAAGLRE